MRCSLIAVEKKVTAISNSPLFKSMMWIEMNTCLFTPDLGWLFGTLADGMHVGVRMPHGDYRDGVTWKAYVAALH